MPTGQQQTQPSYEWVFIFIIYANHDQGRMVVDPRNPTGGRINETALWVDQLKNDLLGLKITTKYKILILENKIIEGIDTTYMQELINGQLLNLITPIHEPFGLQRAPELGARLKQLSETVTAERVCTVFCDHGSLFGINEVTLNMSQSNSSLPFEVLTNDELAASLKIGFGRIDLLIMYNCNMANIATLFSVRDVVDILVGASSTMFFPGYNFTHVLNKLGSDPAKMSADQIAELLISSLDKDNKMYNVSSSDPVVHACVKEIDTWIISKFCLRDINDEFVASFNHLCIELMKTVETIFGIIRSVIRKICPLDRNARQFKHVLFDLQSFIQNLFESLNEPTISGNYADLLKALVLLKANVPQNNIFIGKQAFNNGTFEPYKTELQHPSGLGIVFPTERRDVEVQIESFFDGGGNPLAAFFTQTGWLKFYAAYASLLPRL